MRNHRLSAEEGCVCTGLWGGLQLRDKRKEKRKGGAGVSLLQLQSSKTGGILLPSGRCGWREATVVQKGRGAAGSSAAPAVQYGVKRWL